MGIIIFGLNGSGKSTLAQEVARQLGYKHMDIEEYAFIKSEIPYAKQRSKEDYYRLIAKDMKKHKNFVFSIVNGDLCQEVSAFYKLGVFLDAPSEIRIARVEKRIVEKHGDRVKLNGDMYLLQKKFLTYVKTCSLTPVEKWSKNLNIPVMRLDGCEAIEVNTQKIIQHWSTIMNTGKRSDRS